MRGDETKRPEYEYRLRRVQIWQTELRSAYEEGYEVGLKEGREEVRKAGREEGRREGAVSVLRRVTQTRFGQVPEWLDSWFSRQKNIASLEQFVDAVVQVSSLDELRSRLPKP